MLKTLVGAHGAATWTGDSGKIVSWTGERAFGSQHLDHDTLLLNSSMVGHIDILDHEFYTA